MPKPGIGSPIMAGEENFEFNTTRLFAAAQNNNFPGSPICFVGVPVNQGAPFQRRTWTACSYMAIWAGAEWSDGMTMIAFAFLNSVA